MVLKHGGVVLFPTETAYGLAVDATNPRAVKRVHEIKGRAEEKTFPLIAADAKMAESVMKLSPRLLALAKKHWPGALTIVAPVQKKSGLAKEVVREEGTIAVRVSSGAIAKALAKGLGSPITSTSANKSGETTCYSVRAFFKQLPEADVFVLDGGAIPRRALSTIIVEENGQIIVRRQGSIRI